MTITYDENPKITRKRLADDIGKVQDRREHVTAVFVGKRQLRELAVLCNDPAAPPDMAFDPDNPPPFMQVMGLPFVPVAAEDHYIVIGEIPRIPKTESEITEILMETAEKCGAKLSPITGEKTDRGGQTFRLRDAHEFARHLEKAAAHHEHRKLGGSQAQQWEFFFRDWRVSLVGTLDACFLRIDPIKDDGK